MEMIVSGVINEDKEVFIQFLDGERNAEGKLPICKITKNVGFTETEVSQLETYLEENKSQIINEAININPIKAMMRD